ERSRVGGGGAERLAGRRLRRCVAMDAQRLRALSGLSSTVRRNRRIQRQIHGQSNGAARLVAGDAAPSFACDLWQFLFFRAQVAIPRIEASGTPKLSVSPRV